MQRAHVQQLFILMAVVSLCGTASGTTWYVNGKMKYSGEGTSWETALKVIQEGIDAASDGDTVIVAQDTYYENIHFKGKNVILRSIDPTDPDVVAETIIDGGQAVSVVTFSGSEDETCVVAGLTIRNGMADSGGGICGGAAGNYTQATIRNNVITANQAIAEWPNGGGGVAYCDGTIMNNIILRNSAGIPPQYSSRGGGLYECDGIIRNNTICFNICSSTWNDGGGLSHCDALITECIIWGNLAGTGSQLFESSQPTYSCIEEWEGGGVGNVSDYPHFVDLRAGDYHLQSWSPCIDAGDPSSDFSNEPEPNGGRINIGAYGNTPEAASASQDTDEDSLPDDWEMRFLSDLQYGPSHDMDADGVSNIVEYCRGTDPGREDVYYVDRGVGVPGDGKTWDTAFSEIQEGIDASSHWYTVVVAEGVYYENIALEGKNITLRSKDPLDPAVVADTIIDGWNNGSVVTFFGTEDETCALSGFTLRDGMAKSGGGIDGNRTRATLKHNIISDCSADNAGGGIFDCNGIIENNIIRGNSAGWGGGVGISDGIIRNNVISANSAAILGGGLSGCQGTIENNFITGNSANELGGGVTYCLGTIRGNLIVGNSAGLDGGGLIVCSGAVQNNTVVGNSAGREGGGLWGCHGTILNCVIWGNSAPTGAQLRESSPPKYSCIQRWTGGTGNTSEDPRFIDLDGLDNNARTYEDNNYRVAPGSPCIDAGSNKDWMWEALDMDGNPRIIHGGLSLTVDMGAYECNPREMLKIFRNVEGVQLIWISQPDTVYIVWSCPHLLAEEWDFEISIVSSDPTTSWADAAPLGRTKFYRIEMQ